jgi:hypothetical protein
MKGVIYVTGLAKEENDIWYEHICSPVFSMNILYEAIPLGIIWYPELILAVLIVPIYKIEALKQSFSLLLSLRKSRIVSKPSPSGFAYTSYM